MRMGNVECGLPRIAARLSCGDKSFPFAIGDLMTGTALMIIEQPQLEFNIPLRSPYPTLHDVRFSMFPVMGEPENEGFEQDSETDALH
ncbi:hypothetical protein SPECIALG_206 [Erwinia phage vB_EamM_Special G]|uniref:Uncharacterized protein n=1 Tax=Erwinia phage vB_EamM_Special G TaxID=1815989 RepID=A0A191ZC91_9CAUD|nr:hypothetical protein FDI00_gp205 [Erwinia phage vB_EamM_Special G]ANJ65015.3 hypothetical protein SPECIALG_206 [Erwinia phage vB_EamM_Special G]